jgi:hypothetical protein
MSLRDKSVRLYNTGKKDENVLEIYSTWVRINSVDCVLTVLQRTYLDVCRKKKRTKKRQERSPPSSIITIKQYRWL